MAGSRVRQQLWSRRTAHRRDCPWMDRQAHACCCMDTDAVRRHRRIGLLSRRPPRPMPRTLHHGFSLHRLRHRHDHSPPRGTSLASPHRPFARILRLHRHRRLGLRQHLHRTPLGSSVGQERPSTHLHGHCLVVCRSTGDMAVASPLWKTTTKRLTWHCHHAHRLGYVCAPPGSPPLNHGPLRLRLDSHGSRSRTHRRDLLPAQRLTRQPRAEQLAAFDSFCMSNASHLMPFPTLPSCSFSIHPSMLSPIPSLPSSLHSPHKSSPTSSLCNHALRISSPPKPINQPTTN